MVSAVNKLCPTVWRHLPYVLTYRDHALAYQNMLQGCVYENLPFCECTANLLVLIKTIFIRVTVIAVVQ